MKICAKTKRVTVSKSLKCAENTWSREINVRMRKQQVEQVRKCRQAQKKCANAKKNEKQRENCCNAQK
jgi:hypothetical protein